MLRLVRCFSKRVKPPKVLSTDSVVTLNDLKAAVAAAETPETIRHILKEIKARTARLNVSYDTALLAMLEQLRPREPSFLSALFMSHLASRSSAAVNISMGTALLEAFKRDGAAPSPSELIFIVRRIKKSSHGRVPLELTQLITPLATRIPPKLATALRQKIRPVQLGIRHSERPASGLPQTSAFLRSLDALAASGSPPPPKDCEVVLVTRIAHESGIYGITLNPRPQATRKNGNKDEEKESSAQNSA